MTGITHGKGLYYAVTVNINGEHKQPTHFQTMRGNMFVRCYIVAYMCANMMSDVFHMCLGELV